ncbi:MAG TPA: PDZ domain-containing protein [Gemmatimonadales bacterium]|nr:PDZ domain-containing protein [Gemmatimonadales bacterium]
MRHILFVTALCAATTAGVSPASAQGQIRMFAYGRPRLGVVVDVNADSARDKVGARIKEVTPGGPADKAGLKSGDIVTRFNGKSLAGVKSDDDGMSGPGQRLIELAHDLDSGDTVKVEYRRGSETKTVTLVASDVGRGDMARTYRFDNPGMNGFAYRMPAMGEMPRIMLDRPGGPDFFRMRMRGAGLNLIDLNPDLGEYFGTKEGVLVVSTPEDSVVPLKAGDVILALDGRKPRSSGHAQRILDSYEPGETIKADIMRKQKRVSVSWTAPKERDHMMWKMDHDSDDKMHGEMRFRPDSRTAPKTPAPPAGRT